MIRKKIQKWAFCGFLATLVMACQGTGVREEGTDPGATPSVQTGDFRVSLAIGSLEDVKRSGLSGPTVPFAEVGGEYRLEMTVRLPDEKQILITVDDEKGRIRSGRILFPEKEFRMIPIPSGRSWVVGLSSADLALTFPKSPAEFRLEVEIGKDRVSRAMQFSYSVAMPALSVRKGGGISGNSTRLYAGYVGKDFVKGELFVTDLDLRNPSTSVPLQIFVRYSSRGEFRQVGRVGKPGEVAYTLATAEVGSLRLSRTPRGAPAQGETMPFPDDWMRIDLAPGERVVVELQLRPHTTSLLEVPQAAGSTPGFRLAGRIGRTVVSTLNGVPPSEVEAVLTDASLESERVRVLTRSSGRSAAALAEETSAELSFGAPLTEEEFASAAPRLRDGNAAYSLNPPPRPL